MPPISFLVFNDNSEVISVIVIVVAVIIIIIMMMKMINHIE